MLIERQSPPAANQGGSNVDGLDTFIVPSTADHPPLNAHVVIVSTPDEKARRRVYLSLPGAEQALQRAESCGHTETWHLCCLAHVVADLEGVLAW